MIYITKAAERCLVCWPGAGVLAVGGVVVGHMGQKEFARGVSMVGAGGVSMVGAGGVSAVGAGGVSMVRAGGVSVGWSSKKLHMMFSSESCVSNCSSHSSRSLAKQKNGCMRDKTTC
jgi:type IV secretory pathway TrbL component